MAKILLDVDGVVCDFISGYLGLVDKVTGKSFDHSHVTDWSFKKCLGLTDLEEKFVHARLFDPGVVRNLSCLRGAKEGVDALKKVGHEIVFVTSPWKGHPTWAHEREGWLEERWPGCSIVSTHEKWHVRGDFLVDDKPEHLARWSEHNPGMTVLWDAHYNQSFNHPRRLSSWNDLFYVVAVALTPRPGGALVKELY